MKPIAVTQFKARCLALLEEVARTGRSFVVTKRGKPLVRIVPTAADGLGRPQDSLFGTVEIVGDVMAPVVPVTAWDAVTGVVAPARRSKRRSR